MIYLASASPRRQELLHQLGIPFEVIPSHIEETRGATESPTDYVHRVAIEKVHHVATDIARSGRPPYPILGADTEVVLDGEVLGKPRDREHGISMLTRLQGRTHDVLCAVALLHHGEQYTALSSSRVTFSPMTVTEIVRYWETGEPVGKAGAYAIQGCAAAFIQRIEGSYSGIVGLPLFELSQLCQQAGILLND